MTAPSPIDTAREALERDLHEILREEIGAQMGDRVWTSTGAVTRIIDALPAPGGRWTEEQLEPAARGVCDALYLDPDVWASDQTMRGDEKPTWKVVASTLRAALSTLNATPPVASEQAVGAVQESARELEAYARRLGERSGFASHIRRVLAALSRGEAAEDPSNRAYASEAVIADLTRHPEAGAPSREAIKQSILDNLRVGYDHIADAPVLHDLDQTADRILSLFPTPPDKAVLGGMGEKLSRLANQLAGALEVISAPYLSFAIDRATGEALLALLSERPAAEGWLPIVLCPTDGVDRALKLADGTELMGSFSPVRRRWEGVEPYQSETAVYQKSGGFIAGTDPRPAQPLEAAGASAVHGTMRLMLREDCLPTHFRPNDTVHGLPTPKSTLPAPPALPQDVEGGECG